MCCEWAAFTITKPAASRTSNGLNYPGTLLKGQRACMRKRNKLEKNGLTSTEFTNDHLTHSVQFVRHRKVICKKFFCSFFYQLSSIKVLFPLMHAGALNSRA